MRCGQRRNLPENWEPQVTHLRATTAHPAGTWDGPAIDTVTLDFDARFRRRIVLGTDQGRELLLDLAQATPLAHGDGLVTGAGIVEVIAAPEKLAEIRANDDAHLVRLAWHLGNRHLPTEICGEVLRIRYDHVIVDMAQKLGARVAQVTAPFTPEGGAYGHGRTHSHD